MDPDLFLGSFYFGIEYYGYGYGLYNIINRNYQAILYEYYCVQSKSAKIEIPPKAGP